jgi:signal transduction histidine kinase
MGLRKKITLWFCAVLGVVALVGYIGLSLTLGPAFDELEDMASRQDLARVQSGVAAPLKVLNNVSIDWGQWDETYNFVGGENPEFDDINVERDSLTALNINLMAIYDLEGELHAGMYVDFESADTLPVNEAILNSELLAALQDHNAEDSALSGIAQSGLGPMLFYSRPITLSDGSGPMRGTFIVGRMLDRALISEIGEGAEVDVEPVLISAAESNKHSPDMFGDVAQTTTDRVRVNEQVLHDLSGVPVMILRVSSARNVSSLGRSAMASALWLFVGLGVLVVVALGWFLGKQVIEPVHRLRSTMLDVGEDRAESAQIDLERTDEIGDLSRAFGDMLDSLDEMKRKNIEQSFKAGMAEVAAGALHNIRNSLMPIVNNVAMARDCMTQQANPNVATALAEVGSEVTPPERQEKLLEFLRVAHDRSLSELEVGIENLDHATIQLDHAAQILREQEQYAHAKPIIEKVRIAELIDAAMGIISADHSGNIQVDVQDGIDDVQVLAHRVGLMQVIGNLFVNAVEAITRAEKNVGQISVSARRKNQNSDDLVELTIQDNGVGVDVEELESLFERGYTTKENSGGLGLHWSANTLASMGGEIEASSEGRGRGARFHVTLEAA